MTSREVSLVGSPPFSDADCSVYNNSEGSSGSLGGAAARSTTASCSERQKDARRAGLGPAASERKSEEDFWIYCRKKKIKKKRRRVVKSSQPVASCCKAASELSFTTNVTNVTVCPPPAPLLSGQSAVLVPVNWKRVVHLSRGTSRTFALPSVTFTSRSVAFSHTVSRSFVFFVPCQRHPPRLPARRTAPRRKPIF